MDHRGEMLLFLQRMRPCVACPLPLRLALPAAAFSPPPALRPACSPPRCLTPSNPFNRGGGGRFRVWQSGTTRVTKRRQPPPVLSIEELVGSGPSGRTARVTVGWNPGRKQWLPPAPCTPDDHDPDPPGHPLSRGNSSQQGNLQEGSTPSTPGGHLPVPWRWDGRPHPGGGFAASPPRSGNGRCGAGPAAVGGAPPGAQTEWVRVRSNGGEWTHQAGVAGGLGRRPWKGRRRASTQASRRAPTADASEPEAGGDGRGETT